MRKGPRFVTSSRSPRPANKTKETLDVTAEGLSHDGRGVARHNGKTLFVDDLLPGESASVTIQQQRNRFDEAKLLKRHTSAAERCPPRCQHAGVCGGCALQHLEPRAQLHYKQANTLMQLKRIGGVEPEQVLPPLDASAWGYRRRARFSLNSHQRGQQLQLGFRARASKQIIHLNECPILEPRAEQLRSALANRLPKLNNPRAITHVEVALGDNDAALLLRHPQPIAAADLDQLEQLATEMSADLYLQPGDGSQVIQHLGNGSARLHYQLNNGDITFAWHPTDFTQVNGAINRKMVAQALELLDPQPQDQILDLFCGLGNFTLPLARKAASVTGVEGSLAMVERGTENATLNKISNCAFYCADLTQPLHQHPWFGHGFDKIVLDPPRTGAYTLLQQLPLKGIQGLLYISCDPATFARDAALLADRGMRLHRWGIMNMFPHTHHIESMGLFLPGKSR